MKKKEETQPVGVSSSRSKAYPTLEGTVQPLSLRGFCFNSGQFLTSTILFAFTAKTFPVVLRGISYLSGNLATVNAELSNFFAHLTPPAEPRST
jgi:hypothetical protein